MCALFFVQVGLANRGVAVYADKAYLAHLGRAGDRARPDEREGGMGRDRGSPAEGYSITMAPLAAEGKIIVGASGGEFGIRGSVDAYDAATGKRIWRFWTIPSPDQGSWYGREVHYPGRRAEPRDIAREKRDSARFADAWRKGARRSTPPRRTTRTPPALRRHRQSLLGRRCLSPGRQPLQHLARRDRHRQRHAEVVLPDGSP